jgi:hypothetical protein
VFFHYFRRGPDQLDRVFVLDRPILKKKPLNKKWFLAISCGYDGLFKILRIAKSAIRTKWLVMALADFW